LINQLDALIPKGALASSDDHMPGSWLVSAVTPINPDDWLTLRPDDWLTLREIRLTALQESPDLFLSSHEAEESYSEEKWRAEFDRGCWNLYLVDGKVAGLVGVTQDPESPADTRYLEYVWVKPGSRRQGVARRMLKIVLDRLRIAGIRTAFLWVMDGNDVALHVYKQLGFIRTDYVQPARPGRTEERLRMDLA
jgi:ribosomal protein S18 acetylase RimI-like enzyme